MSEQVEVHIHLHLPPELAAAFSGLLPRILQNTERLITMAEDLSQQVDVATATIQTTVDGIQADVTSIAAELHAGIPPAGSTITQAQVDALNAQVTRLQGVKSSMDALVTPAPSNPAP